MALKFIFGPSGSGKSYQLYQYVIQESMIHPGEQYIVLVPEQFTMQTQKDVVLMHPNHGIMNIDVLSFARLAYRIFEETGGNVLPVLDDEGKSLILRKIAGDYEDELYVLRSNMKKPGYISEVKSVISEFDQYDIGEEELSLMQEAAGEASRLYYKLQDIQTLYRGFKKYLEDKFITKEELLDVLCMEVSKSHILKGSTVVLDGFTGFTPVQTRLIRELLHCCKEVVITVTMDERENPYVYRHPYQLFGLSKHMVTSILEIAKTDNIEVEEPLCLYDHTPHRFRDHDSMAFLERNLFRYGQDRYDKEQDNISLHVARNPREEAFAAVAGVRALVRTEGYRYRDIGVITGSMEIYGDYLEQAFEAYEIPYFMDHKRSILLNSFVEYIRSLLNMVEQSFSYESVFRFLRTNLTGFRYDEVDELENYVIALGIRGYKRWQERWIRKPKGVDEEALERLNHYRVLFVEKIDGFVLLMRRRGKTVRDITMALYEFAVKEELQMRIQLQEQKFQEAGDLALAKEYSQIYHILMELFDKFVELLGDEKVSLKEYIELLDAGLEEARVGVIPPSVDQVVAGDMLRTRLKDIKALVFVGANDTFLPGTLIRTGLLSERDREKFQAGHIALSPGGKEKAYEQKFYLYTNLTKPSEKLNIYYSKVSADGKSLRPAYLIQELRRIFSSIQVVDEENRLFEEKEWKEELGIEELIRGFRDGLAFDDSAWKELYTWYKKHPEWQEKVERLLRAGFYHCPTDELTREIAKKLYGKTFESSITRMESFQMCAFAHFLTYGLKLQERMQYEFKQMDLGNICHGALEYFSKKIGEKKLSWLALTEEEQQKYVAESVEAAIVDYGNSILYSSSRNEYMIVRIKKLLERTVWALTRQLAAGDFVPKAYEMRFSNGKIDRVDICEDDDKVYVKVMDYKTGKTAFDVVALYHGLQLQLMVYMDAALQAEKRLHPHQEVIPAGVFYYHIQDPLVDKEDSENVEKSILKELKVDGIVNLKDEVLNHLDHKMSGESLTIPVKFNKSGELSKTSKVASEEEFALMMRHALRKVEESKERILGGETTPYPYRKGEKNACEYCAYRHVCGFDQKIPGYEYHDIDKMTKEEAIAAMKEMDDGWE